MFDYRISILSSMIVTTINNQPIDCPKSNLQSLGNFPKWEVVVGIFDIDDESGEPTFVDWYRGTDLHKAIASYKGDGRLKADDISIFINGRYEHNLSLALQEIANN